MFNRDLKNGKNNGKGNSPRPVGNQSTPSSGFAGQTFPSMPPAVAPPAVGPEMEYHGIYIKGLPPNMGNSALRALFKDCGEIRKHHIWRYENGASKGNASLEFASAEAARKAVRDFHGRDLHGRFQLNVTYDQRSIKPVSRPPPAGSAPVGPTPTMYGGVSTLPLAGPAGVAPTPTGRRPGAPPPPQPEPVVVATPPVLSSCDPVIVATPKHRKCIRVDGIGSGRHWGLVHANMMWYSGQGSHKIVGITHVPANRAIIEFAAPNGAEHAIRRMAGEDFGAGNVVQLNLI